MSTEWIHVITATKLPVPRGSNSTPFEFYADGFDPNIDTPFGPEHESMFLPVTRVAQPTVNNVLYKLVQYQTTGANGVDYPGHYIDPDWIVEWEQLDQDIAVSQKLKINELLADRDTNVADGFTVGPFQFPLTEHFFRLMADRLRWLEDAIAAVYQAPDGHTVTSNDEITFSDLSGKQVSVGYDTLKQRFIEFGYEYLLMNEVVVNKTDAINAATTPAMVDAVSWSF
jgi:hypothetical protein